MQIVLLAGGSGKRLWPLSNAVRSKQFLKAYDVSDEENGMMISRVYRQVKEVCPESNILITTNEKNVAMLETIVKDVEFCIEPEQKDTFPSACLALAYLHDRKKVADDETVILCPVDVDADISFFETFWELAELVRKGAHLALVAVKPDHPSDQFAYILPKTEDRQSSCGWYREKPTVEEAEKCIEQGAFWSGGVYAFEIGYMLRCMKEIEEFADYSDLYRGFKKLKKRSFARTIAEKEQDVWLIRYNGRWADMGNWLTFSRGRERKDSRNAIISQESKNVRIINELHIPVLCVGCDNVLIAAAAGGILVSDLNRCTDIKPYVESLMEKVMFAERTWGNFLILDIQKESLTIKITLLKGHQMNYHSHARRNEIWTVVSGKGRVMIDGKSKVVEAGDIIKLPVGCRHTVYADTDLHIIEVQLGSDISGEDKIIFEQPQDF